MLKNILRYKEAVEPADLQQFVVLKESLNLGTVAICAVSIPDGALTASPSCLLTSLPPLLLPFELTPSLLDIQTKRLRTRC